MNEAGASEVEIEKAISDTMVVRDSAQKIMESHGLEHLGKTTNINDLICIDNPTRIKELVSIAAAFAVNCTSNLEKHIDAAKTVGITDDEVESVLDAAAFIRGEATHYVEQIVTLEAKYDELEQLHKELQETQAHLVQSEKMAALGKLVAGLVHEMNTPLGALNSATDVSSRSITNILNVLESSKTLDELKTNKQLYDSLEVLRNNNPITTAASERITKLVNSLKNFARLDEATFQKACIHEGLDSTLTLIEPEFKTDIRLDKQFGNIPMIACYPAELNQVFMNLIMNGVQAIEGEGTITIRTSMKDGNVNVQIADTGVGINPEQLERLFEPEFTKKESRMKAGLGLFTSFNIIQKHHGEIKVESEVGKGSNFTVILPNDLEDKIKEQKISQPTSQTSRCDRL